MKEKELVEREELLPSTDFSEFEVYLSRLGLPTSNIIASPDERMRIMKALPEFIESLPIEIRRDAKYLSKFIAGSAVGLFDASLNFVWNEVVSSLRKKVITYGLDIFFDAAVGENLRDQYEDEEDLSGLKDKTLLDTCRKLELISDTVHKKLSHILDLRNNIGASHPTTYSINSYELLGWLQTCINEVLQDETSGAAITVKKIISNLKRTRSKLDKNTIDSFEKSIKDISTEMVGKLLITIFGIHVSNSTEAIIRENILIIAPIVWSHAKEEKKYDLGLKVDSYKVNLDKDKVSLAESFFDICDGNRYLSLDTRIIKLDNLCEDLERAHDERDNFYHETPLARSIMSHIERSDDIPKERQERIIRTIAMCRIGREVSYRNGVSPGAKKYYDAFFSLLSKDQVILLLRIMKEPVIRNSLHGTIRKNNAKEILEMIRSVALGERLNEIIDFLLKSKKLDTALITKDFKDLSKGILQ